MDPEVRLFCQLPFPRSRKNAEPLTWCENITQKQPVDLLCER